MHTLSYVYKTVSSFSDSSKRKLEIDRLKNRQYYVNNSNYFHRQLQKSFAPNKWSLSSMAIKSNHSPGRTLVLQNSTKPCIAQRHGMLQLPTDGSHANQIFLCIHFYQNTAKFTILSLSLIFHRTIKQQCKSCVADMIVRPETIISSDDHILKYGIPMP